MEYRTLGESDIKVSEVSFGCMSLGDNHKENESLLLQAFDNGINFFDTADLYQFGNNEISVGKSLKEIREKVVIGTKVGNQWRKDRSGWEWNPSKAYILQAVEDSLQRLQTDYIDLYQLHGGTIDDPIDETIEAFERLKEAGKIKAYGISSIRPNVIRTYLKKSNISSIMMQYSLLDRRPEEECLDAIKASKVSVITRGSLAKGLLAGKSPTSYLNHTEQDVKNAADTVLSLAKKIGISPAQLALRFVLAHSAIDSTVCGIRTLSQLQDIAQTQYALPLGNRVLEELKESIKSKLYTSHR